MKNESPSNNSSENHDLISVIMPCYNAEAFLADSINSVLNQSYPNIELIVVDDGSTDNSKAILDGFGKRIKTLFQSNCGPGPARNRGIEQATGDFIAFLDSDDYWDPRCLELLYLAIQSSNAALAYCGWQNIGKTTKPTPPYVPPNYQTGDKVQDFLKSAAPWPIHAALVRHDVLKQTGNFDEQWATCMDYDLWLRIGTTHPIVLVPEVLAFYRHHGTGQITSKQWRQAENVLKVKLHYIKNHPNLVKHLTSARLDELTYGAYLKRGFDAYWKRDLVSAHKIFRKCLLSRHYKLSDLKYLLFALLPEGLYVKFISFSDKSILEKIKHFVFVQKCIPWSVSKKFSDWTERKLYFSYPSFYRLIKFKTIKNRVTPLTSEPNHHFFGYYDKTPWSESGNKILTHSVAFNDRPPTPDDILTIGYVTPNNPHSFIAIAETKAWNWQQGAMLQWHPLAPDSKIFFNERSDGKFIGICYDLETKEKVVYGRPIYAVSPEGDLAYSINFSRLFDFRPGYGYAGVPDPFRDHKQPTDDGIFKIDLNSGNSDLIVSLKQLADLNPLPSMQNANHYINHIQICPSGERLAFFHIWHIDDKEWYVRFYTIKPDGSDLDCLLDTGDISHYDWMNDNCILVWAKHPNATNNHFLLCNVNDKSINVIGKEELKEDGHCSFSPDRKWIVNDTYPNEYDHRTLMLIRNSDHKVIKLHNFYSPKNKWWGEIRCDLHPRWNRNGDKICVDSVHSGTRQMYTIDLKGII